MFEAMMQNMRDQIQPLARDVGMRAETWGVAVLARLDLILAAVQSEEYAEQRKRPAFSAAGGSFEVPTGEVWLLEAVAQDVAGTVAIHHGGRVRWIKTFAAADTVEGSGVLLTDGEYSVTVSAGSVVLQLRSRRVSARKRLTATHPGADLGPNGHGARLEGERHVGPPVIRRSMGDVPNQPTTG